MKKPILYPGLSCSMTAHQVTTQWIPSLYDSVSSPLKSLSSSLGEVMTGLRGGLFISSSEMTESHAALCDIAHKQIPLVLHLGLFDGFNTSHEAYHALDHAAFFKFFARNAQEIADLTLIAHRVAEMSLLPGLIAQDYHALSGQVESLKLPEPELIQEFLGRSGDLIESPTPAQKLLFGEKRKRIPEMWNIAAPLLSGVLYHPEDYASRLAAQKFYFWDHIQPIIHEAMESFGRLTGRFYQPLDTYQLEDADYLLLGQGSTLQIACDVVDYFRSEKRIKLGVIHVSMLRPFRGDLLGKLLMNRQGVSLIERVGGALSQDLPLNQEVQSVIYKCCANGWAHKESIPHPSYAIYQDGRCVPALYSVSMGGTHTRMQDLLPIVENMLPHGARKQRSHVVPSIQNAQSSLPKQQVLHQKILDAYPNMEQEILGSYSNQTEAHNHGLVSTHPMALKGIAEESLPIADTHHFWAQTGCSLARNPDYLPLPDPFLATGTLPKSTAILRDWSESRSHHPQWLADRCTGCGDCWMICPDSALPPVVLESTDFFETVIKRLEAAGHPVEHLPKALRSLDKIFQAALAQVKPPRGALPFLTAAMDQVLSMSSLADSEKEKLSKEITLFKNEVGVFPLAVTETFFSGGKGGLLSVTLNPEKCKGCLECVAECPEQALVHVAQTNETLQTLKKNFTFWQSLPNTSQKFIQAENHPTLFLDRYAYHSMAGGDSQVPGSSQKTILHLLTSMVSSLMRSRKQAFREQLKALLENFKTHIQIKLSVKVEDFNQLDQILDNFKGRDLKLSDLAKQLDKRADPIDTAWLSRMTEILNQLNRFYQIYSEENENRYAPLGMVGGAEPELSWMATFPDNPFSFPHTLVTDQPLVAQGLFEGSMKKMLEGFKAVRIAEMELIGQYQPEQQASFFKNFSWRDLTDQEFALCPPVIVITSKKALYHRALHSLTRILEEKIPIRFLILDDLQLPAHTTLTGVIHPNTFVMQGSLGDKTHLMSSFVEGFSTRKAALLHVFCSDLYKEGVADSATRQARQVLFSGGYPLFCYSHEEGRNIHECLTLKDSAFETSAKSLYKLVYQNTEGLEEVKEIPYTFIDFAATEPGFKNHFKRVNPKESYEALIPLVEYLQLDHEEKVACIPFIWFVDDKKNLCQLKVDQTLISQYEERQAFVKALQSLKRMDVIAVDEAGIIQKANLEMIEKVTQSLVELVL